ncbi:phasin-related domain-containing protein [Leptospira yasudae]|uniref:Chemotaxis protein n=1 Tax=Leptospira yasudae TaxID=2202201 RepID=A0A6N4QQD8_9LEPT|nr:chemotaxis protein [Leptospira yasudae]TGL81440.1 chemotaxis protein [Leptospira yasudae]TGL81717.1 chemotaxis protein [Leptospira yasudae]TGL88093.1 chemotaxis protein [Leptospira yasudae]
MDQQIRDGLNAGFGVLKIGREQIESLKQSLNKNFQDLVAKGAADNSESVMRLREFVDTIFKRYSGLASQAEKGYEDVRSKFSEVVDQFTSSKPKKSPQASMKKTAA